MGLTYIYGTITAKKGKQAAVKFLVDSGPMYSLLPEATWKALGIKPKRDMEFTLADGTVVTRKIGECHISLPQGDGTMPVILGEPGDEALLGAVTLEILGLILNPYQPHTPTDAGDAGVVRWVAACKWFSKCAPSVTPSASAISAIERVA